MNDPKIFDLLRRVGALIIDSHIVYTSGKHGTAYVNKDAVYPHTQEISKLCRIIAEKFIQTEVEVVIGPVVGGVILSQWTAYHLSELIGREILSTYADKDGDTFVIKRGYDKVVTGRNVLVVEDILTTGGSVKKVVETVRSINGNVIAVAAICNRGSITPKDIGGVPELYALTEINLDSWEESDCPLCHKGIPINTEVGKGREFLNRNKKK